MCVHTGIFLSECVGMGESDINKEGFFSYVILKYIFYPSHMQARICDFVFVTSDFGIWFLQQLYKDESMFEIFNNKHDRNSWC